MTTSISLTFTGDLSFSGIFKEKVRDEAEIFSTELLNQMAAVDYFVTNLEGPVSKANLIQGSSTDLRQPLNTIRYLKDRTTPVFNLANNHSADCGKTGIQETVAEIETFSLLHLGVNSEIDITYLHSGGISVALIALSIAQNQHLNRLGLFSSKSMRRLKQLSDQAAEKSDWVIVNFHGGEEFTHYPSPFKRKLLRTIATLPQVDVIIAHHAHVFQGIDKYNNKPIFYSLGNFVFDTPAHKSYSYTDESALVNFTFTKEDFLYTLFPIQIDSANGLISEGNPNLLESIAKRSGFSDYYKNWMREAYRVLYSTKRKTNSIKNMPPGKLISNARFYSRLKQIAFDPENRSKYVAAILYRILIKIGIKL